MLHRRLDSTRFAFISNTFLTRKHLLPLFFATRFARRRTPRCSRLRLMNGTGRSRRGARSRRRPFRRAPPPRLSGTSRKVRVREERSDELKGRVDVDGVSLLRGDISARNVAAASFDAISNVVNTSSLATRFARRSPEQSLCQRRAHRAFELGEGGRDGLREHPGYNDGRH